MRLWSSTLSSAAAVDGLVTTLSRKAGCAMTALHYHANKYKSPAVPIQWFWISKLWISTNVGAPIFRSQNYAAAYTSGRSHPRVDDDNQTRACMQEHVRKSSGENPEDAEISSLPVAEPRSCAVRESWRQILRWVDGKARSSISTEAV